MRRLCTLIILLLVSASVTSLFSQTPATPSPSPAPATLRSVLLSELHSTHDKAEWFTPMNTAVAGLTAEQAKWVPQNARGKLDHRANHSVGMLAYHLVFWNENALARLHGEKPADPRNNDETFYNFDAAHWNDIVQRLDRVMKNLEAEIERIPEEKLAEVAPTISHICTHNAYHVGQILYVRKLQGSWNPANGVK
ncbi:MAG: DinB family protein [Chthoniobacterales bacterium]